VHTSWEWCGLIDGAANSLPQVRAGSIKAYAVTAKSRKES
jgi:tripartite-type tricarboxylate transporter receptor subunit TctC